MGKLETFLSYLRSTFTNNIVDSGRILVDTVDGQKSITFNQIFDTSQYPSINITIEGENGELVGSHIIEEITGDLPTCPSYASGFVIGLYDHDGIALDCSSNTQLIHWVATGKLRE